MATLKNINLKKRVARKFRVRKKISGDSARPRVTVYFSNRNVYAQMIDDTCGKTLVSASTKDKDTPVTGKNIDAAKLIGARLAEKAAGLGITNVVFDRNGYKYHGKTKELAEAIRSKGLLK